MPDATGKAAFAAIALSIFLGGGCSSPQTQIQQQQEKLESLGSTTQMLGEDWLGGHLSATYMMTALEATLAQVEQQRAVLAATPTLLADAHGARLSQQADALSRLIAQLTRDVHSGDSGAVRRRLGTIPIVPDRP